jgi:alpha-ketoglutarate-dependent sulfate ester dioxygenase
MSVPRTELHTRRLTGNIGAEISGVRLSADLPEEVIASIRAAALANRVVFFRGQHHLDDAEQIAFASRFGTVTRSYPSMTGAHEPDVLEPTAVADVTNTWHTDVTFVIQPPSFSMLRAVAMPPVGGDTLWANTAIAYAALPAGLREMAANLWAMHTNRRIEYPAGSGQGPDQGPRPARSPVPGQDRGMDQRQRQEPAFRPPDRNASRSLVFKATHPVVRVHAETGERCLLLGSYARGFTGYNSAAFETIFKLLQDVIVRPEHTVRWSWQVGDLIIWDNRATQHFAVKDYGSAERRVRRVTVVGEIPVSIDGQTGRAVQGDSSAYNRQTAGSFGTADAIA